MKPVSGLTRMLSSLISSTSTGDRWMYSQRSLASVRLAVSVLLVELTSQNALALLYVTVISGSDLRKSRDTGRNWDAEKVQNSGSGRIQVLAAAPSCFRYAGFACVPAPSICAIDLSVGANSRWMM